MAGKWRGKKVEVPERVYSRHEIQKMLKERIGRGDEKAKRIWEEYKRVDKLFDVFREIPLYKETGK